MKVVDGRSVPMGDGARERQAKKSLYGTSAEFAFVAMPLLVIFIFHVLEGHEFAAVLRAPDWSFASSVLFGQSLVKFVFGLSARNRRSASEGASFIAAVVLVAGLVPSLFILYAMLNARSPSGFLIAIQLVFFVAGSVTFLVLGSASAAMIAEERQHREVASDTASSAR